MCSIFIKATQPFNFMKLNLLRKLAYKVYIDFDKLVDSIANIMERMNARKRSIINFSVFKVLR